MHVKSLIFAAGLASAAPHVVPRNVTAPASIVAAPDYFHVVTIRPASTLDHSSFKAAKGSLFLNLPRSNASCDATVGDWATFYLKDGAAYLYKTDNPPQQLYTDRSGMGMGKLGYVTGAQSPPRNAELTGFAFASDGGLEFDGAGFKACPNSIEGAWSLWVDTGVEKPGWNEGCISVKTRVIEELSPVGCLYTE